MIPKYIFPFGQVLHKVEQKDKMPKALFVLGVYASAVHAKWIGASGKILVNALAVASEPYIFWKGEDAQDIINKISFPEKLGRLELPNSAFNGPSGNTLDKSYLLPLGYSRTSSWLSDLIPETRLNTGQFKAIKEKYNRYKHEFNLPEVTIPPVPSPFKIEDRRRLEILKEIEQCQPKIIILLGDQPIKHFLNYFIENPRYKKLSDFGENESNYGNIHDFVINDKQYRILPLVHPRQAGGLSSHSNKWKSLHEYWKKNKAEKIKTKIYSDKST